MSGLMGVSAPGLGPAPPCDDPLVRFVEDMERHRESRRASGCGSFSEDSRDTAMMVMAQRVLDLERRLAEMKRGGA